MNKLEFLFEMKSRLSGLPQEDVEERLTFYSEMIDDRMDEGLTEEEAVSAIGNVDEIVAQIISDIPITKLVKEKIKPKNRRSVWQMLLLILGSPIWICVLIAVFAVIVSLYITLWSVVVSLWAVFASLVVCAFGGAVSGTFLICYGSGFSGLAFIGAGCILAGLSVFVLFGCKAATKGTVFLTKKVVHGIRNRLTGKETS